MDISSHEEIQGRNQKQYRCYLFRTIGILCAVCVFFMLCNVLDYIYYREDFWIRSLWHNFYEDKGKIENLYLGSSHVYDDINPLMLDSINGEYNFNLATPLQPLDATFYLINEADRLNTLSHVYVELFYECSVTDHDRLEDPIDIRQTNNWVNNGYMEISINRIRYMLSTLETEDCVEACFPFVRYRECLGDWEYIHKTLRQKETYFAYRNREKNGNDYDNYRKSGQKISDTVVLDTQRCILQGKELNEDFLGEKSKQYLIKIINYCQERDIPLTLFISPMDELQLLSTEYYDSYINQIREIASDYEVAFYDFNLVREQYLPIHQNQYYKDFGHLNSEGAAMFTSFFGQVMAGTPSENEAYFHSSYQEKLQELPPSVYGLYYYMENEQKILHVASNRESGLEYRIILTPENGEQYMAQDFSDNHIFSVSEQDHGVCTIVARIKDSGEVIKTLEVQY